MTVRAGLARVGHDPRGCWPRFHAYREVIRRYAAQPAPDRPDLPARLAPQTASVDGWVALFDSLDAFDAPRRAPMPLPMEALDQVTLYAPAPLWRAGTNEVVMLELEHPSTDAICGRNPAWVAPLPDLQPRGNPTNG